LLNEEEYYAAQDEFGEGTFEAGIGAEALKKILSAIDLEAEKEKARKICARPHRKPSARNSSSA
jgi:DNA-directed RNA polymerase subunit beta'